ncbi:MAG: multicopper oxidase family protein [Polyangiaceae bacterium]|nr:multicopper oxidase family protein [Polyangiaceae bacterium]
MRRAWALGVVVAAVACAGGELDRPRDAVVTTPFGSPPLAADLDPRADHVAVSLRAAPLGGSTTRLGYSGASPGPTVRARVGDTVEVTLDNQLAEPTTIHLHGVHLPYEMDGDGHGAPPVAPGERFTYRFVAERAGTFWYHPHVGAVTQVRAGLYGALIIEDPRDPAAEEVVLVFSEVPGEAFDPPSHAHATPLSVDYRRGQSWLVNGARSPSLSLASGTVVRARLVNASADAPLRLSWPGVRVIGTDQGLLPAPHDADEVPLMPGDRAEVEWRVGASPFDVVALPDSVVGPVGGDAVTLLSVAPTGELDAPASRAWGAPALPAVDLARPVDATWVFTGGGEGSDLRINGERFPDVTPTPAPLGQELVIELRNLSSTRHPFHLHGHPFRVFSVDGAPPGFESWEDTTALEPFSTRRVLVRPALPGEWMAHCHLLTHAAGGMATILSVRQP